MANPGLTAFIRSPGHPLNIDPHDDDPYLDEGDNDSDYMPPASFGRWRTPGQTTRVPTQVGPPFAPGETPEDVIHGEVISPEEEAGADSILKGEHESEQPSSNPDVETARQDLHTPESAVAVSALARLLRGAHPGSMGRDEMDAAHEWLSRRFTGLRVNPNHGTLVAMSPTGKQMVRRQTQHALEEPAYTLTNKHGTFESRDPQRLVRALVAFQIVHNEIAARRKKDDDDDSLKSTSGFFHNMVDAFREGYKTPSPFKAPHGAAFEPGNGTETNENGVRGGYVMPAITAPNDWHVDGGTAYSPGHSMRLMLDPTESTKVREDPRFKGHTFTYAPTRDHAVPRQHGGITYYVRNNIHPAARGAGFDAPLQQPANTTPRPVRKKTPSRAPQGRGQRSVSPAPQPEPPQPEPHESWSPGLVHGPEGWEWKDDKPMDKEAAAQANDLCPVCASGYLEPYDSEFHECLNCGSLVKHVGFEKESAWNGEDEPTDAELADLFAEHDRLGDEHDEYRRQYGVAHPDDWSDLPPGETRTIHYDRTPDGSLVERNWEDDLLFPHESSKARQRKRPGGLGRGLADIMEYEGDPLNLASGGSENPDNVVDLDETMAHHPLADEELPEDADTYEAPRRILGSETDPIEEFMGKQGFQPIHKPGQSRIYMMPLVGSPGSYARLTEGAAKADGEPSGWSLTADHIPESNFTKDDVPQRSIPLERSTKGTTKPKDFRQPLPDAQNRMVGGKTFLASGSHPIKDYTLNRAIRDVAQRGRGSKPYWDAVNQSSYEMPAPPPDTGTQRERRMLSSVGNPGLNRFVVSAS